jgi:hypothetical protein
MMLSAMRGSSSSTRIERPLRSDFPNTQLQQQEAHRKCNLLAPPIERKCLYETVTLCLLGRVSATILSSLIFAANEQNPRYREEGSVSADHPGEPLRDEVHCRLQSSGRRG